MIPQRTAARLQSPARVASSACSISDLHTTIPDFLNVSTATFSIVILHIWAHLYRGPAARVKVFVGIFTRRGRLTYRLNKC